MKKSFVLFIIILAAVSTVYTQGLEISGMLRSQNAVGLESGDIHEIRETLNLNLEYRGDSGALKITPYFNIDPLTSEDDQPELGVREAYIDLFGNHFDIRIGKQAVFWGQAEGAFITDIVSPQNLSSFILNDFEEIRIGIPAVKTTFYTGPLTLETVWVQKFISSILPDSDSIWRTALMPDLSLASLPKASLENSEFFARASFFSSLFTLELVGAYGWNDLPVAEGSPSSPDLVYHRSIMTGGILSTTFGPLGIRAEGALTLDKPYASLQGGMPPALVVENHDLIQGLLGVDGTFGEYNLSAQYILQYIADFKETLVNQEEMVHTVTIRIQRAFMNDRLSASIFGYVGFDPMDSLIRPELSYSIEDGLDISLRSDIFLGEPDGRFGVYEDNTQMTGTVSWYF